MDEEAYKATQCYLLHTCMNEKNINQEFLQVIKPQPSGLKADVSNQWFIFLWEEICGDPWHKKCAHQLPDLWACLHAVRNPAATSRGTAHTTFIRAVFQQGKHWAIPCGRHLKKTCEYFASSVVDVGCPVSAPITSPAIRDAGKVKGATYKKVQKIAVCKYDCSAPRAPVFDDNPQFSCCLQKLIISYHVMAPRCIFRGTRLPPSLQVRCRQLQPERRETPAAEPGSKWNELKGNDFPKRRLGGIIRNKLKSKQLFSRKQWNRCNNIYYWKLLNMPINFEGT